MKKIILFVLSVCFCLFFVGCSVNPTTNDIKSFTLTNASRMYYTVGDTFTPDGGKVCIIRSNGEMENIPFDNENITLIYPQTLLYWTDDQRVGVYYKDPINDFTPTETKYLSIKVGTNLSNSISGYSNWKNDNLFVSYPKSYSVEENNESTDNTINIVNFVGTNNWISIRSGSISTLKYDLKQSTSYLDNRYSQEYQTAYRKSYNDDSLQVTVNHQNLTTAEFDSLKHFQWKDALHRIIRIKKGGTFLGLGNWETCIDQYIIEGNGNTIDISFGTHSSVAYDNIEIQKVLSSLMVKYSVVDIDAP